MEAVLTFARGPLLCFALAVFCLGLLRQVGLTVGELVLAYRRAGNQVLPYGHLVRQTLRSIFPANALRGARAPYTVASMIFHLGVLFVPIFLRAHIHILMDGTGLTWPLLNPGVADGLTLAALAALLTLLMLRLGNRTARFLSGFQDWLLPVVCLVVFLSGYGMAHPATHPLRFPMIYLTHLLSAELLLILTPFTKLAHVVLFPLTRLSWELGWHFVPGAGEKVRISLGKEGEPV